MLGVGAGAGEVDGGEGRTQRLRVGQPPLLVFAVEQRECRRSRPAPATTVASERARYRGNADAAEPSRLRSGAGKRPRGTGIGSMSAGGSMSRLSAVRIQNGEPDRQGERRGLLEILPLLGELDREEDQAGDQQQRAPRPGAAGLARCRRRSPRPEQRDDAAPTRRRKTNLGAVTMLCSRDVLAGEVAPADPPEAVESDRDQRHEKSTFAMASSPARGPPGAPARNAETDAGESDREDQQ